MTDNVFDLKEVITFEKVCESLANTDKAGGFIRVDFPPTPTGMNPTVEVLWEVSGGDFLFKEDNTLGYCVNHLTAVFVAEPTDTTATIALKTLVSVKVEASANGSDGDLRLQFDADSALFDDLVLRAADSQKRQGWDQPNLVAQEA